MKFKITKKSSYLISFLISFLALFFILSCKSTSAEGTRIKTDFITSFDQEPFYIQAKNSFEEKKLSNGIPLIIKTSTAQKDCTVRLVIDAESLSNPEQKAGIEEITLKLMKFGSASYSSNYISSLEYTDSAFFELKAHRDYLEFGFTAPLSSLENICAVFADVFKNPLMDTEDFESLISEASELLEKNKDDARQSLLNGACGFLSLQDKYFTVNTYSAKTKLTYQDVFSYQKALLNASKIKIVASGNFTLKDVEKLYSDLNSQFGSLKSKAYKKRSPAVKTLDLPAEIRTVSGDGLFNECLMGVYKIPPVCSEEYVKYSLMTLFIDDILYRDIKEKNGYADDIGSGIIAGNIPLGVIMACGLHSQKDLISYSTELIQKAFESGTLDKKIDSFRRIYTSVVMSSELSSSKTCSQMATSLVYSGNASEYIKRPYLIRTVTAEDVKKAYDETLGSKILWFKVSRE